MSVWSSGANTDSYIHKTHSITNPSLTLQAAAAKNCIAVGIIAIRKKSRKGAWNSG